MTKILLKSMIIIVKTLHGSKPNKYQKETNSKNKRTQIQQKLTTIDLISLKKKKTNIEKSHVH